MLPLFCPPKVLQPNLKRGCAQREPMTMLQGTQDCVFGVDENRRGWSENRSGKGFQLFGRRMKIGKEEKMG